MAASAASVVFKTNLKRYWLIYVGGCFSVLLCNMTEVAVPKFVQWAIDLLNKKDIAAVPNFFQRSDLMQTLFALMFGFSATLFIGWATRIGWRQTLAKITHTIGYDLRSRFWRQLRFQPLSTFHKHGLGDLMTIASGDWNAARFIHGFTLVGVMDLLFFTTLGLGLMISIDPWLTFFCLVPIVFVPRKLLKLSKEEYTSYLKSQETLSTLSDEIAGTLRTVKLQRATGTGEIWQKQLNQVAQKYADERFVVSKIGLTIFPWIATPSALSYAIVLVLGLQKVQSDLLTLGELIALLSYIQLMQHPLWELGFLVADWQKGMASLGRLTNIFNMPIHKNFEASPSGSLEVKKNVPALQISNLTFQYPGDQRRLFDHASLSVPQGSVVGLQGPIGVGKSTLLGICAGLQTGFSGDVWAYGHSVQDVQRDWLTENVTVVPQRAFLFSGTVLQNLSLDGDFSEQRIWKVLEIVQIKEEIESLPQGIHSWIGEWGINLSGGQRQRLAIARALLRPQPLLLLDDCLSAVDAITEEGILAGLRQEFSNQTVLWVAHRASTLRYCDEMYEIRNAKFVKVN